MAHLGFDAFLGEEVFAGATRSGLYVADAEVARIGAELLREEGPSVFVFAITMQNHDPWPVAAAESETDLARLPR